jgi:hypothetical protein
MKWEILQLHLQLQYYWICFVYAWLACFIATKTLHFYPADCVDVENERCYNWTNDVLSATGAHVVITLLLLLSQSLNVPICYFLYEHAYLSSSAFLCQTNLTSKIFPTAYGSQLNSLTSIIRHDILTYFLPPRNFPFISTRKDLYIFC